jgi:AraC family transcriptional regulator
MSQPGVRTGPTLPAGSFGVTRISYPPGYCQPPHRHAAGSITLVLRGVIRETAGGAEETGSALSLVVKPPDVRHADLVGPGGADTLQVALPVSTLDPVGAPDPFGPGWRWLHAHAAARAMLSLLGLYQAGRAAAAQEGVVEVLAALPTDGPVWREPPGWVRLAREALDDQVLAGPTVMDLARAVGAHPVSLSRAFRRHFGVTVTAYRRRERLRRAAAAIGASDAHLSRIAQDAGYADHPQLCREFRRATGVPPSRFRGLVQAG